MESAVYRIEVFERLGESRRTQIYDFLCDQFDRIKGEHPADQLLTPEQYDGVLSNDAAFVIVCLDHEDEMVGATLVTNDVDAVEWASGSYFEAIYAGDEPDETTPIFFIAALAVSKSAPPQVLNAMIDRLTDIVADADGVAIADLADKDRNYSLAKHIAARVAMRYESDWQSLGSQTYHAFRPGRKLNPITPAAAKRLIRGSPDGPGVLRK